MKALFLTTIIIFLTFILNGQEDMDSILLIKQVNRWEHFMSEKPSLRYCDNKKCEGIVRDTFNNGQVKHLGNYSDGLMHGETINFYSTGQKKSVGKYQLGHKFGKWNFYYENGALESFCIFNNEIRNPVLEIYLSEQGDTLEKTQLDNDFDIDYQFFFNETGDTTFAFYKLEELEKGKKYQYKNYHKSGGLKEEGLLIIKTDGKQQKIGNWYTYDSDEILIGIEIYKN